MNKFRLTIFSIALHYGTLFSILVCVTKINAAQISYSVAWECRLRSSLEQMVTTLTNTDRPWPVPDHTFRVDNFGAIPDGRTVNTAAIQKVINLCSAEGGGVVLLSKGNYVTGTIVLKSGVILEVEKGARLLGSTNLADYPAEVPKHKTVMDTWMKITQSLIYADNCKCIGICGKGFIDGRGGVKNFPGKATSAELPGRPFLIRIIGCRHVVIDGIHLRNAASWMENYLDCDDVILQGVNVQNQCNWNNDGFDIDGCHNVIVRDCIINAEDDAMCFKGAGLRTMENVLVENCHAYSTCNALKFGTDSEAGFNNVLIRNVEVGGVPKNLPAFQRKRAISGIAWEAVDGGNVENIFVTNVNIVRVQSPIFLRIGDRGRTKPGMPRPPVSTLKRIIFDHITGTDNGKRGSIIAGIPGHRVADVIIQNVQISMAGGGKLEEAQANPLERIAQYPEANMFGPTLPAFGFWLRHAENISFQNVCVTPLKPDERPEIAADRDINHIWFNGN